MTAPFDITKYVKKIVESKPAGSGNPFRDGRYTPVIKKLQIKPSDKEEGKVWFIAEFKIVKSEAVDVPPNLITPELPLHLPNAVGSDASMVVDLNTKMGPSNVKELAAADLNKAHDQITEDELTAWISTNVETPGKQWSGLVQPLAGRAFNMHTVRTLTQSGKNAGKPGVRLRWSFMDQSQQGNTVAELRPLALS